MSHQGRYFMTIPPCRAPLHITQLLSQRQLIFYQKHNTNVITYPDDMPTTSYRPSPPKTSQPRRRTAPFSRRRGEPLSAPFGAEVKRKKRRFPAMETKNRARCVGGWANMS